MPKKQETDWPKKSGMQYIGSEMQFEKFDTKVRSLPGMRTESEI